MKFARLARIYSHAANLSLFSQENITLISREFNSRKLVKVHIPGLLRRIVALSIIDVKNEVVCSPIASWLRKKLHIFDEKLLEISFLPSSMIRSLQCRLNQRR